MTPAAAVTVPTRSSEANASVNTPVGAADFEDPFVYQVDITLDPPVLVHKNTRYWLDVQTVFPFADGIRSTFQTWWMMSQNNTGLRAWAARPGLARISHRAYGKRLPFVR